MREYAAMLTGASTAMITIFCLIEFTEMEFFSMLFVTGMIAFFAVCIFAIATEPRKHKARWEKTGKYDELEVMTMGKFRR